MTRLERGSSASTGLSSSSADGARTERARLAAFSAGLIGRPRVRLPSRSRSDAAPTICGEVLGASESRRSTTSAMTTVTLSRALALRATSISRSAAALGFGDSERISSMMSRRTKSLRPSEQSR